MNVLAELRARFHVALTSLCDDPATYSSMVKPVQDARFGDYQANCAMPLAKQQGVNPRDLAARILANLDVAEFCESPEIAGPGFINLKLRTDWLTAEINRVVRDDRLGVPRAAVPQTIIIDYSAPNIAKPMHVGHLRSSVIGDALYRILGFLGHKVIGDNHIGDWGTQFGMIIFGYKHFLDQAAFERNSVGELARLYRLVNQLSDYHDAKAAILALEVPFAELQTALRHAEAIPVPTDKSLLEARKKQLKRLSADIADFKEKIASAQKKITAIDQDLELSRLAAHYPRIAVEAREETAKLHAGNAENVGLWKQFMPACLAAIQKMYDRLGVRFDYALGESFYQPMLADVVSDLLAKGLAVESDGAICVFVAGIDAPFIIRKTDGAFTYATTDLATIKYRVEHFKADRILYVVDARQGDHFKLLFEVAKKWGYDAENYRHVSFGTVLGDDKRPFKTRAGDTVGLESLLDEGVTLARRIVDAGEDSKTDGSGRSEGERNHVAEVVGLGAIKYADLSQNRESDYVFNWEKMLAMNGDTATYMQYAYARVCGIFRKGSVDRAALRTSGGAVVITTPAERALTLQLLRFSEALDQAGSDCRPNLLTGYLFETANNFSTFFEQCPVLKAETDALRTSRLLLADLTARIIAQGLALLGIDTVEQM